MKSAGKSFAVLLLVALGACSSQKPAPVVERSGAPGSGRPPAVSERPATTTREARDGVYTVQRGDTLYSIAMAFGVDVRDLARWNGLADAGVLRVGQPLRITPPSEPTVATVTPVTPGGSTEVRPLPAPGGPGVATPLPPSATATAPTAPESASAAKPDVSPAPAPSMQWLWPAAGKVIDGFDAPRNKGIDIGGNEGEPVLAAADGEVVHVGSALRGYGNLVIIRHPGDYVTAYGHNRKILVSQGQQVKRGQQIAELGRTDSDRPKLHFEIRHQGKPLDPVKYLQPR
jgi:lipoprotein NlpD